MYVKAKYVKHTVVLKTFMNKGTCDCSFINLSPIFSIFRTVVDNDIVDMSHDYGSMINILVGNYVLA